jgi:integrase
MKDNGRNAVCCPDHPEQKASKFIVRFGRKIFKRFASYELASRFLNGIRFKTDENTFDIRDYQRDNPLGFSNLVDKYLEMKSQIIKPGSVTHVRGDLNKAKQWWGFTNIKEIHYAEIEDFLLGQKDIRGKTRHNIKANLHALFMWLVKRQIIRKDQLPDFPVISFELGWRATISKDTQDLILDEVKRISSANPRIYLAIRMLCTYVSVRPGEILGILEQDVFLDRGFMLIRDHKTMKHAKAPKEVPLLDEDVEALRSLPRGFPMSPLFRRDKGGGGRHSGTPFGNHLLYNVWKQACANLGIAGIDLYGGTRHTTLQFLRQHMSTEDVKRLTQHSTNKALDRYIEIQHQELRDGYALTRRPMGSKGKNVLPIKPGKD